MPCGAPVLLAFLLVTVTTGPEGTRWPGGRRLRDGHELYWWVELIVNAVEGDEEGVTALRELTQSSVGFSMNLSCTCAG